MSEMKPPMFDRVVTHERAREAAHRLVNSHFRQEPHARASIPANEDDDDLVITDYITQRIDAAAALADAVDALREIAQADGGAYTQDYQPDVDRLAAIAEKTLKKHGYSVWPDLTAEGGTGR